MIDLIKINNYLSQKMPDGFEVSFNFGLQENDILIEFIYLNKKNKESVSAN